MGESVKKWIRILFRAVNIAIILLYLLVCLVPFLNGGRFWYISFLGLGFPYLLICLLFFLCYWAVKRSKWFFAVLITLLLGFQQISVMIGLSFSSREKAGLKSEIAVRVMTWNVFRWDEQNKKAKGGVSNRKLMIDAVNKQNADILCFQEFFEPRNTTDFENNIDTFTTLGYGYHYFFPSSIIVNGAYQFGMIILSKFPIIDSGKISFGKTPHSEGLMYADVKVGQQVVRVFSTHMESSRASSKNYFGEEKNQSGAFTKLTNFVRNIKYAYNYREGQAELVKTTIAASPYPVILCGNLGDVPNSSAYFTVKGKLQDAFLEKGTGLGRTFRFIAPTLRLDYVLVDKKLKVEQYYRPELTYSDHYPIIVDLIL